MGVYLQRDNFTHSYPGYNLDNSSSTINRACSVSTTLCVLVCSDSITSCTFKKKSFFFERISKFQPKIPLLLSFNYLEYGIYIGRRSFTRIFLHFLFNSMSSFEMGIALLGLTWGRFDSCISIGIHSITLLPVSFLILFFSSVKQKSYENHRWGQECFILVCVLLRI
jgi:hypothetical protein